MRVLLWNVKRGPGARRLDWIASQDWDVAILLEVSGHGWHGLCEDDRWAASGTFPDPGSHRYATAILARDGAELAGTIAPPTFDVLGGRYQERVHATSVRFEKQEWTFVAAHMPNSVRSSGRRDHGPKDACYESLGSWLGPRCDQDRVVLGIDTNRGDWPLSESAIRPNGRIAQEFLRYPDRFGLRDIHLDGPDDDVERPETYWTRNGVGYRGHYYDRILVSRNVATEGSPVFHDAVGRPPNALSDHAAVTAALRPA